MSAPCVFVAGSHTEIGKTHVACGLLRAARGHGHAVAALKPVVSGFAAADWSDSDPGRLLAAVGIPATQEALEAISPWRFAAPLAPPTAALQEGRSLLLGPVIDFCRARIAASTADFTVVEGVGGLMSPIAEKATSLDLMSALGCPSLFVSGSYLGAVSHTLTALEVLRGRRMTPRVLVVSQSGDPDAPSLEGTLDLLADHASEIPIIAAPRDGEEDWADRALSLLLERAFVHDPAQTSGG